MPVQSGQGRSLPVGAGLKPVQSGQGRSLPVGAGLKPVQSGQGRSLPVVAGEGRCRWGKVPVRDGAGTCTNFYRPLPNGAAEGPQETL